MEEQLIEFSTAKLAKEKGFIWPINFWYRLKDGKLYQLSRSEYEQKQLLIGNVVLAPTQSLLQKWLREIHKIDVNVLPYNTIKKYYEVWISNSGLTYSRYAAYEEALEVGLQEALKLISDKKNKQ